MAHDNQIVNANIMTRVLQVDGRQYLITAKHLTGERDIGEIEIWWEQWRRTKVSVVGMGEGREDIAVLSAKGALTQSLPIEVGSGGITVGQSVRFLGFPLGIAGNSGILIATGIETALKLIASNPIGFPVAAKRIGDGSSAEQ